MKSHKLFGIKKPDRNLIFFSRWRSKKERKNYQQLKALFFFCFLLLYWSWVENRVTDRLKGEGTRCEGWGVWVAIWREMGEQRLDNRWVRSVGPWGSRKSDGVSGSSAGTEWTRFQIQAASSSARRRYIKMGMFCQSWRRYLVLYPTILEYWQPYAGKNSTIKIWPYMETLIFVATKNHWFSECLEWSHTKTATFPQF